MFLTLKPHLNVLICSFFLKNSISVVIMEANPYYATQKSSNKPLSLVFTTKWQFGGLFFYVNHLLRHSWMAHKTVIPQSGFSMVPHLTTIQQWCARMANWCLLHLWRGYEKSRDSYALLVVCKKWSWNGLVRKMPFDSCHDAFSMWRHFSKTIILMRLECCNIVEEKIWDFTRLRFLVSIVFFLKKCIKWFIFGVLRKFGQLAFSRVLAYFLHIFSCKLQAKTAKKSVCERED